jgi:hypothetical protein
MTTKVNGKLTSSDIARADELAALMLLVRDQLDRLEQRYEKERAPWVEKRKLLEGAALEFLKATGQESARTANGTIHVVTRHTASLADGEAFMEFVMARGLFELLERRASSTACRDYAEENGELPPGVKINTFETAQVRKAS